jgi:hypothetical protein
MIEAVSAAGDGTSLTPDAFVEIDDHRKLPLAHRSTPLALREDTLPCALILEMWFGRSLAFASDRVRLSLC